MTQAWEVCTAFNECGFIQRTFLKKFLGYIYWGVLPLEEFTCARANLKKKKALTIPPFHYITDRQTIIPRYSPCRSMAEWKNDSPHQHQNKQMSHKMNTDKKALHSLSSCLHTKHNWLSGISWDSGQVGKGKAQQVCEIKDCELTKCAAVSSSPLGFFFLLQTLQNYYEKHKSIPSDQWPAWKATKTNPLRTCMTGDTCVLVTQVLQRLPAWHSIFLRLGRINKLNESRKDPLQPISSLICQNVLYFFKILNSKGNFRSVQVRPEGSEV